MPVRRQAATIEQLVVTNAGGLASMLIEDDPEITGFADHANLKATLRTLGPLDEGELDRFVGVYDPLNSGRVNFYTILADIANKNGPDPELLAAVGVGDSGPPSPAPSPVRGGGRASPGASPPAPPVAAPTPSPPQARPQPVGGVDRGRLIQIAKELGLRTAKTMGSAQTAWNKWRGGDATLMARGFSSGVTRDLGIDLSVAEAQALIDSMGGKMTMGKFVQLLGSGPDALVNDAVKEGLDEDNKWLLHIARQAEGKPWEKIMRGAANVEMMCANLKKVGIFITPPDFRPVMEKFGVEECVRRVKVLMDHL